jgi:hypothetical protein
VALANGQIVVRDYFTPANQKLLDAKDLDLGSGGPVLLPDQPGEHAHLLLAGGKDGSLFLLDRDRLGKHAPQGAGHPVQVLKMTGGIYAPAAYWNGHVYILAANDYLSDFALNAGKLSERPVARSGQKFANPGAPLAISADGARNGIVWAIETKVWNAWDTEKPAALHAFDATNVAHELYTSERNAARDRAGPAVRFTIPTIAGGRVYVPARREVDVYGLLK